MTGGTNVQKQLHNRQPCQIELAPYAILDVCRKFAKLQGLLLCFWWTHLGDVKKERPQRTPSGLTSTTF